MKKLIFVSMIALAALMISCGGRGATAPAEAVIDATEVVAGDVTADAACVCGEACTTECPDSCKVECAPKAEAAPEATK